VSLFIIEKITFFELRLAYNLKLPNL